MRRATLDALSREELEAENARLRAALGDAGIEPDRAGERHGAAPAVRKDIRSALADSNARQRAIFESATEFAIIATDRAGVITDWNPGAERASGWTAAEMRGQDSTRLFTPEDRANGRPQEEMQQALEFGRAADERWHLRKSGERFWASGEMMPLFDGDNIHLGYVKILRDRTAEHLAGVTLKQTQERYRLAVKATNDAIWDWDLVSDRVHWNEALEEAFGHRLTGTDMTGQWWIGQIHPEDRARIEAAVYTVIDGTGTVWTDNYRFRRADGTYAPVLNRGNVIRGADGQAVRMIGAMLDLSGMRAAEAALRRSEERFRAIIESVDEAFAIVQVKFDADDQPINYRFLEANPAFERQAGVNLRGKWVTEFAPDLERFWFETYGHVAKTGEPAVFENYASHFERWFDVRAVRVGDPADRQIAILFTDTTERRTAEERLRVSERLARENVERVQLAMEAGAIIGTWHWDLPADRFTVDEAFARAFGLDPSLGREGLSFAQVVATVHPDDREGLTAAINDVVARGGAYAHQYRVRRADGLYHWIEANGRVHHDADGTPLSFPGVLINVEERHMLAAERDRALKELRDLNDTLEQRVTERTAELMKAEEALRQSQKMEAVGQLTGGLAHDFNNLLAGISGSLELMSVRIGQGRFKDVEKYMVAAQGATRRAAALTHRLLAFSRRQTLDPKATDVNTLVRGMLDLIRRTVGPGIAVEYVAREDLWTALVDASQLENALLNLCINARDAMPDGGTIVIETDNRAIDALAAEMRDMPEGEYLVLSVSDNGCGMPPEVLARAFEPFFTTKPTGQGTGLGLSMIYGFARQSGGQVRIHSQVGEGTSISIYLPRHAGVTTADDGPEPVAPVATSTGETVLIVDDEPTVRMLVMDVLQELGYTALEASDGAGGLKILQSDVGIDLLVTDVGLPGGMNGRQLADAARVRQPGLKVLFITGFAENALVKNGQLEPGMAVLTKPFAMETLAARLRELIAG